MTYKDYIDNLLSRLDGIQNTSLVRSEINNAVQTLKRKGLSNDHIRKLFTERIVAITEQQSSLEMRKNEQRYKELINSILLDED